MSTEEHAATAKYLDAAARVMVAAHTGQVDKVGMPYVLHPMAVAAMVDGAERKASAMLHDVLEDTEIRAEDLRTEGIPERVIEIVSILTRPEEMGYEEYIKKVGEDADARAIKMADLRHNLDPRRADTGAKAAARHRKYREALAYLEGLEKAKDGEYGFAKAASVDLEETVGLGL